MPSGDPPLRLRDLAAIPLGRLRLNGRAVGVLEPRLGEIGIDSVLDLLQHYPRRWVDRSRRALIADLAVDEEATVVAEVRRASVRKSRHGRKVVDVVVADDSALLSLVFFNQPWRAKQLVVGTEVALFGRLEIYRGGRQMTNPVVDVLGRVNPGEGRTGGIVPVYPQSEKEGVYTEQLRALVADALARCRDRGIADPLDAEIRTARDLVARDVAYRGIHRPETMAELAAARRRLIFDEFLRMQVGLVARKRSFESSQQGIRHTLAGGLVERFHASLPWGLTGDQRRAIAEISADMAGPAPMHRLLQGDVGSGKTVVALSALLVAVQGGYQGAFMAPTEVLAEQHQISSRRLLEGLTVSHEGTLLAERPVRIELLTNRTPALQRREIADGLRRGEVDIVVGTHALVYDTAPDFPRLGLVVIDEQHRFGVEQRAVLRGKGDDPDLLVMTATPIPRTAAMLVYGDLDKSELREMPPGRTPITTEVVGPNPLARAAAYERLRAEVAAGRQAYVVCPRVMESGRSETKTVTAEFDRLRAEELAGLRVGMLHGQVSGRLKEAVMAQFRDRELDVLVATTVIEVGVDVPNATVMIIEDAELFGLSQLHQLRGRIGRGGGASWCFLFADPTTPEGRGRMEAMAASTDGFLLAELDLEIRGAGEVFGDRQSGFSDLKLGRIPRDEEIVMEARAVAEGLLDADPALDRHEQLRAEVEDLLGEDVEFLFKS